MRLDEDGETSCCVVERGSQRISVITAEVLRRIEVTDAPSKLVCFTLPGMASVSVLLRPSSGPCSSPNPLFRGAAKAALHCAQHSHPPNPERAETRSCPKRAHSYRARSASKEGTWPLPSQRSERPLEELLGECHMLLDI